ncbi:hypothetical protein ACWD35_40220, partial [Streptomyces sp. NPDC002671]
VLDAVIAIARGGSGGVPALIEGALARSIPVLLGFLASLLGVGGIAAKVKQIVQAMSKPVDRAVDWVIDKIVGLVKKLWSKIKAKLDAKKKPKPKPKRRPDRKQPGSPRRRKRPDQRRRPDRRRPKRRRDPKKKRPDKRSPADQKRALDAALREANQLIDGESATVGSVRKGLPGIKRRHRLTSIRLVKSGELYHVKLTINPNADSDPAALDLRFTEAGKKFAQQVHEYWWSQILCKAKVGSAGKAVWDRSVVNNTESAALAYIEAQDVAVFRKAHPRAALDKGTVTEYLFKKGSTTRRTFIDKLGGDEGALRNLKSAGKTSAAGDKNTVEILDEMDFLPDRSHYGRWDPFPGREADADQELVAAVKANGLRVFLETLVRAGQVGTITWAKFRDLWDNDTPSREFVKGRFRDLDDGKHEWIPTDYLLEVVESAIGHHEKGDLEKGLDWLRLQDALRSPTNHVIWRVLDTEGALSLGAHVGTFYTRERKSTLTNGTKDFHDGLRNLYMQNKSGTARAFVELLLDILDSDAKAGVSGFRLIWSGDLGNVSPTLLDQPVDALFRVQAGSFLELKLTELGTRQEAAFEAVRNDFRRAKAKLKA